MVTYSSVFISLWLSCFYDAQKDQQHCTGQVILQACPWIKLHRSCLVFFQYLLLFRYDLWRLLGLYTSGLTGSTVVGPPLSSLATDKYWPSRFPRAPLAVPEQRPLQCTHTCPSRAQEAELPQRETIRHDVYLS